MIFEKSVSSRPSEGCRPVASRRDWVVQAMHRGGSCAYFGATVGCIDDADVVSREHQHASVREDFGKRELSGWFKFIPWRCAMRSGAVLLGGLVLMLAMSGCNGQIRTKLWTPAELEKELAREDGIKGVFGYYTKTVIEVSYLTQILDKDGKFATSNCKRVPSKKVVTVTDYDRPYQIYYRAGLLEANKFGVQLSNSVFTAINSESAPDQGKTLANLGESALSFAKVAGAAAVAPEAADCNGAPSFDHYEALGKLP
jgi:hypothetical protein